MMRGPATSCAACASTLSACPVGGRPVGITTRRKGRSLYYRIVWKEEESDLINLEVYQSKGNPIGLEEEEQDEEFMTSGDL